MRKVTLWAMRICGGEKRCLNPEHVLVVCLSCRNGLMKKRMPVAVVDACVVTRHEAA